MIGQRSGSSGSFLQPDLSGGAISDVLAAFSLLADSSSKRYRKVSKQARPEGRRTNDGDRPFIQRPDSTITVTYQTWRTHSCDTLVRAVFALLRTPAIG